MITFENVSKVLGGRSVLNDISFEIQPGEVFVIVGPSGAGKSVTLKHMVRLLTPDDGDVLVDGESVSYASGLELERIRNKFGYLFQGGALIEWLSVVENVALPLLEKTAMGESAAFAKALEMLALVGLELDGEKRPSEISGGMKKRAGLARAIVTEPRIVLYDEPTSGLDPVTSRTIDALIESMRAKLGITSVVVTHDLHSALSIGTTIAMLHEGKIIERCSPEDFVKSGRPEVQAFLESQFITKQGVWERNLQ